MKHDNTRIISMIVFYDNRKSPIFKILGIVVYFLLEKYVCVDYLCLQEQQNFLCNTKYLKRIRLMSSQELAFQKFC